MARKIYSDNPILAEVRCLWDSLDPLGSVESWWMAVARMVHALSPEHRDVVRAGSDMKCGSLVPEDWKFGTAVEITVDSIAAEGAWPDFAVWEMWQTNRIGVDGLLFAGRVLAKYVRLSDLVDPVDF